MRSDQDSLLLAPVKTMAEIDRVRCLFEEYAASLGFHLDFQHFSDELGSLPGAYAAPRGVILLATVAGQPAGCVALRPLSDKICEMKRLYTRPVFRKRGIGRALAEAVVSWGRSSGYQKMRLDTVASMKAARALYSSIGFEQIDAYCYNPLEGATYMELDLGGNR